MKNKLSHISKKSRMIAATAFVLGIAAVGGGVAYASTTQTTGQNSPMSSLVTAIASKFNLNSADVQTVVNNVMETERTARMAQEKTDQASKLAQAVTDGKLTQTQANLITTKLSEMETSRDANRTTDQNLTQEERETKMQAEQASIKEWATNNNIPMNFLQLGGNGHGGQGGPEGNGRNNKVSTAN